MHDCAIIKDNSNTTDSTDKDLEHRKCDEIPNKETLRAMKDAELPKLSKEELRKFKPVGNGNSAVENNVSEVSNSIVIKKHLNALEKTVSSKYSYKNYSIGRYQECAVCIEHEDTGWTVYTGERGNRYNEAKYEDVTTACLAFLGRLTKNEEELTALKKEFMKTINETD